MGENDTRFRFTNAETVPTSTIAAAFTLAVVMGLIVISGVLLKPYEARKVVENLYERIMMEKEYRELSRINYSAGKVEQVAFSTLTDSTFPESGIAPAPSYAITIPPAVVLDKPAQKTDRSENFDREVKSDKFWKSLQASIAGVAKPLPSSAPIVLPPVVVGSAD